MAKEIWLPDSKTHVIVEPDGEIKIWDNIIMTKESLNKSTFGLAQENKEKE
jgi:hypothetical protein